MEYEMNKTKLIVERHLFEFNQSDESYEEMALENDKFIGGTAVVVGQYNYSYQHFVTEKQ